MPSGQEIQVVAGEVLKLEGGTFLVKDVSGKEIMLRVTPETKLDSGSAIIGSVCSINPGDKVVGQKAESGEALLIRKMAH